MKGVFICAAELEALHGLGALSVSAYLHLRLWMDLRSGVVGLSRPITLAMVAAHTESHVTRGRGFEVVQPSQKEVRCALDRLVRAGLLARLAGDRLAFSMPLAATASIRPENAGRNGGTLRGAVENSAKAFSGAGSTAIRASLQGAAFPERGARHQRIGETPTPPHTASTPAPGLRAREAIAAAGGSAEGEAAADLLRGAGVRVLGHEQELAALARVPEADVLAAVELARQERQAAGSTQPVGLRYVVALLDRVRQQSPGKATTAWWSSESAMLAKGAELGLSPRPGEGWGEFRGRVREAALRVA